MALSDALSNETVTPRGPRCSVGALMDTMTPADRAAFIAALAGDVPTSVIFRAVRSEYPGRKTPQQETISRHRRGECRCPSTPDAPKRRKP